MPVAALWNHLRGHLLYPLAVSPHPVRTRLETGRPLVPEATGVSMAWKTGEKVVAFGPRSRANTSEPQLPSTSQREWF